MIENMRFIMRSLKNLRAIYILIVTLKKFSMTILGNYDGKHPDVFFVVLNQQGVIEVSQYLVDRLVQGIVLSPE